MTNALKSVEGKEITPLSYRSSATPSRPPDDWNHIEKTVKRTRMQDLENDCTVVDMEIVDNHIENGQDATSQLEVRVGMETTVSYAAILAGKEKANNRRAAEPEEFENLSDEEEGEGHEEEDRTCPIITLTKDEKLRLRNPWKHTLIVKVWVRQVGYAYLLRRNTSLWKPKAKMDLIAMENNYFLVKFYSIDDHEHAQLDGPWMIMDHCLLVRDWTKYFDPRKANNEEKITVWIHFPNRSAN